MSADYTAGFDHLGLGVADVERSRAFYDKALAPLGVTVISTIEPEQAAPDSTSAKSGSRLYGFGVANNPFFWIGEEPVVGHGSHIAFKAESRDKVDAFYQAAIAAGGRDNGAPGIREVYHPNYYAAFVYDPDGFNVEAVCHLPG